MISLKLEDNKLGEIRAGYFENFRSLKTLILADNKIPAVSKNTMRGLYNLSVLNLAGNNISSVMCDTFDDSSKLKILDLQGNKLPELPCIRSTPETWSLRKLNLRQNNLTDGHNASVATHLSNVTELDLGENDLKELINLLTEIPSVKFLWIDKNIQLRFDPAEFANSGNLIWVNSCKSNIAMPPLFGRAKNTLFYLDFGENGINCTDIDHISNMNEMTLLNFTKNKMIQFPDIGCLTQFPTSSIQDINFPKLMEIILSYNQIYVFPLLPGMPLKSIIRLQYNELREFPSERMALLTKVDILQMQYNKAVEFPDFSRVPSSNMTDLDLSHNNVASIPADHIAPLVCLVYLRLQYNFIRDLPNMSFARKSLQYLYIHHNLIDLLEPMLLQPGQRWAALTHLYASHNFLNQVPELLLNQMHRLIYLDISHNELETMPCVSGVGPTLKTLRLHNNDLTYVPMECMLRLTGLKFLTLNHNFLADFPFSMVFQGSFPSLYKADISNNLITSISTLDSPLIRQSLTMDVRSNTLNCTFELCWLKDFDRFTLYRDDKLCAFPPELFDRSFKDVHGAVLGCYCKYLITLAWYILSTKTKYHSRGLFY